MRVMTIEQLLMKEDDVTLLNIYEELDTGIIPATSYAHEFVRKVNNMIDEGKLCVVPGKYRNVYLPTIAKMVHKEMARRYTMYLCHAKGPEAYGQMSFENIKGYADDDVCKCASCNGEFEETDLIPTDMGMLCKDCISAMRSHDEPVTIYM